MDFVGWSLIGAGIFLIYCAFIGVSPVSEFMSVVTNGPRPARHSIHGAVK